MARSQKDVLEEIFATEERDGTINFSVNGAYQDSFETYPTYFEFGSSDQTCLDTVAGWSRKKNSDKYDYQTGYASLSKQHPEKKSKREGEDYYQVAVPNLQSFINLVADPDLLADKLTKSANALVAIYRAGATNQAGTLASSFDNESMVVFDQIKFAKNGVEHKTQFVVYLSTWTWTNGERPLEKLGKKLTVNDVQIQIRLRTTLNADNVPDKSGISDGFALDGYGYVSRLGHFLGLLRSEEFKKAVALAVQFLEEQKIFDSSIKRDGANPGGKRNKREPRKRQTGKPAGAPANTDDVIDEEELHKISRDLETEITDSQQIE